MKPYHHLLQRPFILCTLAAHYCNVHGAVKVPSLGGHDSLSNQPYGALALSTAAIEHYLTLIIKGNITIQAIEQSKTACKKLTFEHSSSNKKGQTNFSEKCWGSIMHEYMCSVNNLLKASKETIFKEGRWLAKGMTSPHDRACLVMPSTTHTEEAPMGHRTVLVDVA